MFKHSEPEKWLDFQWSNCREEKQLYLKKNPPLIEPPYGRGFLAACSLESLSHFLTIVKAEQNSPSVPPWHNNVHILRIFEVVVRRWVTIKAAMLQSVSPEAGVGLKGGLENKHARVEAVGPARIWSRWELVTLEKLIYVIQNLRGNRSINEFIWMIKPQIWF